MLLHVYSKRSMHNKKGTLEKGREGKPHKEKIMILSRSNRSRSRKTKLDRQAFPPTTDKVGNENVDAVLVIVLLVVKTIST